MDVMNYDFMKLFNAYLPFYLDKEYEYCIRYSAFLSQEMKVVMTHNKEICSEIYTSLHEVRDSELFVKVFDTNEYDFFFNKSAWEDCIKQLKDKAEAASWKAEVIKVPEVANDIVKMETMIDDLSLGFCLQTSITERNDDNTAKTYKTEISNTVSFYVDDREEELFNIFVTLFTIDKAAFAKKFGESVDDYTKADLVEEILVGRNMQIRDYLGV